MAPSTTSSTDNRRRLPEWLIGLLLAVVVTAVGWWVLTLAGAGDDPSFEGLSSESSSDTDGITFALFDGTQTSFEEFRGTPIVLNFWASWCPPCAAEMPDFQVVHERLAGQVTFLGMNSQDTDRAAAERLVAQTGVTYALASDPNGELFTRFGGLGMPTTVFIDADGNIVTTHSGIIFADDLEHVIRMSFGL